MKIYKILMITFIATLLLCTGVYAQGKYLNMDLEYDGKIHKYNAEEITLCINNKELTDLPMPPVIFNGYSLVPAREVFEAFGAAVDWNGTTQQVTIKHENNTVILTINSTQATVNGSVKTLETPAKIINDKTMIPVRFVAEAINKDVRWDSATRTANICDIPVTTTTTKEATTEATTVTTTKAAVTTTKETTTETTTTGPVDVKDVQLKKGDAADTVVINCSGRAAYTSILSQNGDLLTLDIEKATLAGSRGIIEEGTYLKGGFYYQLKEGFVRVSLDMYSDMGYNITVNDSSIMIMLSPSIVNSTDNNNSSDTHHEATDKNGSGNAALGNNAHYSDYSLVLDDPRNVIDIKDIQHTDNYTQNSYVLTIPEDISSLVSSGTYSVGDKFIDSISVNSYGRYSTITFNTVRVIAVDIQREDSQVVINIMNPKDMYDKIIVLDAGHGGDAVGALGSGLVEKELTLDITKRALELFEEDGEIKAYATRESDVNPSFDARTDLGNQVGDAFVSIHINSADSSSAAGTETFCLYPNDPGNGLTSYILAEKLLNNLLDELGTKDRGVKSDNLIVLRQSEIPASLMEVAFISNPEEANRVLASEEYRQRAAQAVFDSVKELFDEYEPIR